jgi:hypothetical protein
MGSDNAHTRGQSILLEIYGFKTIVVLQPKQKCLGLYSQRFLRMIFGNFFSSKECFANTSFLKIVVLQRHYIILIMILLKVTLLIMTLRVMTLLIMTLLIIALLTMTLLVMTLLLMTLLIMIYFQ